MIIIVTDNEGQEWYRIDRVKTITKDINNDQRGTIEFERGKPGLWLARDLQGYAIFKDKPRLNRVTGIWYGTLIRAFSVEAFHDVFGIDQGLNRETCQQIKPLNITFVGKVEQA